jgi:hypothetical protein
VKEKSINKIMKRKSVFVFSLIIIAVFYSCDFNVKVEEKNSRFDKVQAENVGALFYYHTANKNYDSILKLMGENFYKISSQEELKDFLIDKEKKYGAFKDTNLKHWESNTIKDGQSKTEYLLVYEVSYEKYKTIEKLSLIKEGEKVKIFGYHIDDIKN